ncbi:VOC family protein [Pseudoponticoccus marisrubri]|uniref:VOC domain-containing protein n=1 Tax=Pseudoponticoccus marisrubri TaxID=1685382 RepID=A0A0W7WPV5_9RHOB|nr:VOC family protein [Pseudoponticoccus marisrubri]KUF12561.1 hypothetical protein AVJ23_02205 [Pseudoponticoccus marisrubri]
MPLIAFDHVNLRTRQLQTMIDWYGRVLGLLPGPRPPFGFGGAWLYLGEQPYVHLVEKPEQKPSVPDNTMEHFAFRAKDMPAFLETLQEEGVAHSIDPLPGFPIVQVNFRDPDGNHIHVDFDKAEHTG